MNNFRDLYVWDKAVQLATVVYKATEGFPKLEQYEVIKEKLIEIQKMIYSLRKSLK